MALKTRRQSRLEEEEHAAAAVEGSGHSAPEEIKDDLVTKQTAANLEKSNGASSSASSSSSSSSDDESSSGEDSDSEYSSAEEQDLEKLFQASLLACKEKDEATCSGTISSAFEANANQISFSGLERTVENHPPKSLIGSKGKGKEPSDDLEAHFERLKRGDELGVNRPKSEAKYKRDRRREMSKTAGSKWFDLPAFPASSSNTPSGRKKGGKTTYSSHGPTAEEMTREIQAIRLRNAMDPKRFYRGGNGANQKGMPAFAQMGRIISSNLEPSSTMNRSERGRTVIDELVKDAQNAAYTKRKFGEQQSRTDVGRSSHISKHKSRNSGKRQRR